MILQDGLYEQVVNNEIRDEVIDTDKHKELAGIYKIAGKVFIQRCVENIDFFTLLSCKLISKANDTVELNRSRTTNYTYLVQTLCSNCTFVNS